MTTRDELQAAMEQTTGYHKGHNQSCTYNHYHVGPVYDPNQPNCVVGWGSVHTWRHIRDGHYISCNDHNHTYQ